MKMVTAFIRPEVTDKVICALGADGFTAISRVDVYGRGKQNGIDVRGSRYDMPKTMLMTVVDDDCIGKVVEAIGCNARTGSIGDGRIFITPIEGAYTVRTGEVGL
jgi:nitrogen regulatory protein PII 1